MLIYKIIHGNYVDILRIIHANYTLSLSVLGIAVFGMFVCFLLLFWGGSNFSTYSYNPHCSPH